MSSEKQDPLKAETMSENHQRNSGPSAVSPVVITALVRIQDSVLLEARLPEGPAGPRSMQLTLSTYSTGTAITASTGVEEFQAEFAQLDRWMTDRSELVLSIPASHQGVVLADPDGQVVVFGSV